MTAYLKPGDKIVFMHPHSGGAFDRNGPELTKMFKEQGVETLASFVGDQVKFEIVAVVRDE